MEFPFVGFATSHIRRVTIRRPQYLRNLIITPVCFLVLPLLAVAQTPEPGDFVINEVLADPAPDLAGDANGDGYRSPSEDEFIELVNVSGSDLDISGLTLNDQTEIRHTFPAGTVVPPVCAVVVFAGGSPRGAFGGAHVQTATNGDLGLNNGGDIVRLMSGTTEIADFAYGQLGCEGDQDQSLNLFPDLFYPSCILHSVAAGSGGALFSPGTRIDGTLLGDCGILVFTDGFESGGTTNWS